MTKQDFIFSLIRSALWQQPYPHFDMTPGEYHAVMEEAEKQCVQGLIIDCLRSNNMGLQKKCVIHMMKMYNALVAENRRLNSNVTELHQLLSSHGIEYIVMKGQTLAALYPKPELRVPGDIDFYVPEKDFDRAMEVINREWGQELNLDDLRTGHIEFSHHDITLELHNQMQLFHSRNVQKEFDRIVDECKKTSVSIGGKDIQTLPATLNVFYVFCHLFKHLRGAGVALRQLCDWTMVMSRHHEIIDRKVLAEWLKLSGFEHAFAAFGHIVIEKLGLPREQFPVKISERDKKWSKMILDDIIKHGNWGLYQRDLMSEMGVRHSLQRGWLICSRFLKYFWLTPKDNFSFMIYTVPRMTVHSVKTNIKRIGHRQ